MKRIPHARGVGQALRSVRVASQRALKALNQLASKRMAKGDYPAAEALAAKGREIRQYQLEVGALHKRWRELCGAGGHGSGKSVTPLWVYFQPILQALVQAGGRCRRADLEVHVERLMGPSLQTGDRDGIARGLERWRVMVQRARKALAAEGWIADRTGAIWQITDSGRRAAEKPIGKSGMMRE